VRALHPRRCLRPVGALIDPGAKQANLPGRESLAFWRHDQVFLQTSNEMNQAAFRALSWDDDLAVVSTSKRGGFGVQAQPAFLFLRSVTLQAMLGEHGLNIPGKISGNCGCGWKPGGIDIFRDFRSSKRVSGKNENEQQQNAAWGSLQVVEAILPLTWTSHLLAFSAMVGLTELDVQ
jgi:hypothetical protein